MKKILITFILSSFFLTACNSGSDEAPVVVVPAEVEDEYNINLDNALVELDIVE